MILDEMLSRKVVFKIFYLEDEKLLSQEVTRILEQTFPNTCVVLAETIDDGLIKLMDGASFQMGILDVRVPMSKGLQPESHPQVADRLKELKIPTVFITSYRGTEDVEAYLETRSLSDAPVVGLRKSLIPGQLIQDLIEQIRPVFTSHANKVIVECANSVLGNTNALSEPNSATANMHLFQKLAPDYWQHMGDGTKAKIRQSFCVEESEDSVFISLLK